MRLKSFLHVSILSLHIIASGILAADEHLEVITPNREVFEYKQMLKGKRKTHLEAVKTIISLKDYDKQREMVFIMTKKIFEILSTSLKRLSKTHEKETEMKMIQYSQEILQDLSTIIENTAFISDLALRLPKIFHKLYDRKEEWKKTLISAIDLSISSGLIDDESLKGMQLMQQELEMVLKDPEYVNPYKYDRKLESSAKIPKRKRKEKRKRGPGLSGSRVEL